MVPHPDCLPKIRISLPNRIIRGATVLLAGLAAVSFLYRRQIENGFSFLIGDRFDGLIAVSIIEHWFNVLRGFSAWNTTFYFFPNSDTLGYNDGFLAHGLIAAALRSVGFDVFLAPELATMTLKSLGLVAYYLMLRVSFRCPPGWSVLGATLFTIANNLYLALFHVQFAAFSFAPLVILIAGLAISAFQHEKPLRGFLLFGVATAVYGVWFLTSFYDAWFLGFFGIVAVVIFGVTGGLNDLIAFAKQLISKPIGFFLLLTWTAICLVPFLLVYLPKARETGMHPVAAIRFYALEISDVINVGSRNLVWGPLLTRLYDDPPALSSSTTGFPPIFLIISLTSTVAFLVHRTTNPSDRVLRAVAFAVLLTWPCLFRFDQWTPWELIFYAIPGAGAIRSIAVYQCFLTIPLIVLATTWLSRLSLPPLLAAVLTCSLLVEEINMAPIADLSRVEELAWLNRTPKPPRECKVFFASKAREGDDDVDETTRLYSHNVDAGLVAEVMRIPTINGFETFLPPYWNFEDPRSNDYLDNVKEYAARYGIQGLCALDLETRQWRNQGPR